MRLSLSTATCALLLAGALGACGTETSGTSTDGRWRGQTLAGSPGVDFPTVLAVDGEDALVVMLSDGGVLQSHLSIDGAAFEAGARLETDWEFAGLGGAVRHDGGWLTLGSGGLVEVGDDEELTFEVRSFRSEDGLTWEEAPVEGFAGPAEVNGLAEVDGTLVAAGSYRDAEEPAMGGSRSMVWVSEDGASWTEADLPDADEGGYSFVADMAVGEGLLFAVGGAGDHGMLWTSDDAGATWRASSDPAILDSGYLARVAAEDGAVLVSGEGAGPATVLRSDDGGASWSSPTSPPPAENIEGYAPLWAGGGRFFTMVEPSFEAWSEPEVCYADIDQCREAATNEEWALYGSEDGDTWTSVDISGIDAGDEIAEVTGTPSGRVLTLHHVGDGVAVNTWPAGADLPVGQELKEPERVELVTVPEGGDPELGVRYHAPLFIHCGMDWLYLGDQPWQRTDGGPEFETGAGDEPRKDWPVAGQTIFGYATLTDGGVVKYSLADGEVIATYEQTGVQPPGCD
jgi:hypothetical protein